MTALTLSPSLPKGVDAVVVGLAKGPKGPVLVTGSDAVGGKDKDLLTALRALGATGAREEVVRVATLGALPVPVVVAVGLGDVPERGARYDAEVLRRASGAAVRALAGSRRIATTLSAALPDGGLRAVAEGAGLGAYSFTAFRSEASTKDLKAPVAEVVVVDAGGKEAKEAKAALRRADAVVRATWLARDLVNTPPSHLHPAELAATAEERARAAGVKVEVLDEKALRKGGYGGILGVGQGSANPPRLVHLSYRGGGPKVALIGKGITFDSGGLSLKPPTAMEEMKSDMGGAAAVIAATIAAAELGLRVDLEAWVPMAENMPSGTAIRPSDVLTMRGGKRIEVNNTDAEGRLILADAIVRACEDDPEVLIDAATLTGAQLIALGARTSAVMSNDDDLRTSVVDAAGRAGESMWPMPLPDDLRKGLDSEIADMVNTGPREGGMLSAGLFLREFVAEGVRWAHLDIAGPAFNGGQPYGYTPHGGTGAAVRTFVQVLEDMQDGAAGR